MRKKLLFITLLTASTILFAGNYSRSNDIVTDHDRNLQWQDQPYTDAEINAYNETSAGAQIGRAQKWINAEDYCSNLNLDGGGWRLATINELNTTVDTSRSPAMDPIFQNAEKLGYWSRTTYPDNTSQAYGIGFNSGGWHHCNKDGRIKLIQCVREGGGAINTPPTAIAGDDQNAIEGETVTLDGSASTDSDGTIASYEWKEGDTVLSTAVSFDKSDFSVGIHTITLKVTDNDDATNSDSVDITVTATPPPLPTNTPPVAKAGVDQNVIEGDTVILDGSNSTDSEDGAVTAYEWREGYTVLSTLASFDKSDFSAGRTHTIILTVTDSDGASHSDSVNITVTATPPLITNTPPVAKAGSDQSVIEDGTVTLDGSNSSDSDGTIASYEWREGYTVLSTEESFEKSDFSAGRTHTIILTVTDNDDATHSDSVNITVKH